MIYSIHKKLKESTKNVIINKFNVTGYKNNMQNMLLFIITKGEIKKIIPFIITSNRTKYLGTNLYKYVKDLHSEN